MFADVVAKSKTNVFNFAPTSKVTFFQELRLFSYLLLVYRRIWILLLQPGYLKNLNNQNINHNLQR